MRQLLVVLFVVIPMSTMFAMAQLNTQAQKLREPSQENSVAAMLEKARKASGAKPLRRIDFRTEVQSLTCTASVTGHIPMYKTGVPELGFQASALYRTKEPQTNHREIERLASYDPLHKEGYTRFAVAVWRSALPNESDVYWVGIQFYWSAAAEFFDYHFTDDVFYRDVWKTGVARECRSD